MYVRRRGLAPRRSAVAGCATITAVALAVCIGSTTGAAAAGIMNASSTEVSQATEAVVQPDSSIVVAGGSGGDFAVARFSPDGVPDREFGRFGELTTDFGAPDDAANAVAQQPNGDLIVVGTSGGDFAVARYTPSGAPDRRFSRDGKTTTDFGGDTDSAQAVLAQPDGKIVVAGRGADALAIVRYTATGLLDSGFGSGGRLSLPDSPVTDLLLQPDGKLVVVNGHVARFTRKGRVDPTFDSAGLGDGGEGWRLLARQDDGRIVLSGASDCNFALVGRVDLAGAFDSGFSANAGLPVGVKAVGMGVLPGGRLLVVSDGWNDGECTATSGITLERYLADGGRDLAFGSGGSRIVDTRRWPRRTASVPATSAVVAPDGRVVVVGRTYVARFTVLGVLDRSFSRDGILPIAWGSRTWLVRPATTAR